MTTDTQLPKLGTLSPEQRRILCADTLGWRKEYDGWRSPAKVESVKSCGVCTSDIEYPPDPDLNANDALALVEHLGKEGWDFCAQRYPHQSFIVTFWRDVKTPREKHQGKGQTFQQAVTDAALLATGKAEL